MLNTNLKNLLAASLLASLLSACSSSDKSNEAAPSTPTQPSANPGVPPANTGIVSVSAANVSVAQSNGVVTIAVNRAGGASGVASVVFTTANSTAIAGTDYIANSGTLNWEDNDAATKSISVVVSNTFAFAGAKTFSLTLSAAIGATLGAPSMATITINGSGGNSATVDHHILVDQFGYRPSDMKVAVIRNPQIGYDSADKFSPGANYQLRRASDGAPVFSGVIVPWNGGTTQASSGDNGWWFDFSSVSTPDRYYVYDVANNVRSPAFDINQNVYKDILKAAMRTYFYQRSSFAKRAPYAEACWVDDAAYVGANQDTQAHDVTDKLNAGKVRDLSGGWFDAGDTNKYVTFAVTPVHQLLMAYQNNPGVFTDDFNIPESGNGIPDVIDEVKWETDWLKKMQNPDGSAALKVGAIQYTGASPPSSDASPRFYIPTCTSSTIAVAGMYAHASYVYNQFPALASDAADLKSRAINAWNNYQNTPVKQTSCDTGEIKAGIADLSVGEQNAAAVVAAVYLYAITGSSTYNDYVKANYAITRPYNDIGWSRYNAEHGEALLFYTSLSSADTTLRNTLLNDKRNDVNAGNQIYGFAANDDLYRSFMHNGQYHWGSNHPRANYGNSNVDVLTYNLAGANADSYRTRAVEVLHYFHGVNPFGMVYLSNMSSYGATVSANEIYHTWYASGSKWSNAVSSTCGPAPGYVPGGPNANAAADGVPNTLTPPIGQPLQKSYRDWNVGYNASLGINESSWAVTEPGIYYQASYVKLLSVFAQ